jgi:hypothetical protein
MSRPLSSTSPGFKGVKHFIRPDGVDARRELEQEISSVANPGDLLLVARHGRRDSGAVERLVTIDIDERLRRDLGGLRAFVRRLMVLEGEAASAD